VTLALTLGSLSNNYNYGNDYNDNYNYIFQQISAHTYVLTNT